MRTLITPAIALLAFIANDASAVTTYDLIDYTYSGKYTGSVVAETVKGNLTYQVSFFNVYDNARIEFTEQNSEHTGNETDFTADYTFDERSTGNDFYGSFHLGTYISRPDVPPNGGYLFLSNLTPYIGFSGRAVLVSTTAIPEPTTYALMIAGLGVLGVVARRKRSTR